MAKFEYTEFRGGTHDEFVVHAKKYSKEEAIEIMVEETAYDGIIELEAVQKQWCRYYVRVPDFCNYDDGEGGGCYTYCNEGERGAFPVWVIEY